MLQSTTQIFKSALAANPTVPVVERNRLLKIVREGPAPEPPATIEARLLRRGEVARRLAVSLRTVDSLARTGTLKRIILPGRTRAAGFLESEVVRLLEGRAA